jgi:hypothetical protein
LLPPEPRGGPILHGARAHAYRAYKNWKAAIDDLWGDEYEALLVKQAACARQSEAAHHQRLLDEHTARARQQEAARQEAACAAQRLLHKRAALECQGEAAPSPTRRSGTADGGRPSHLLVAPPPTPLSIFAAVGVVFSTNCTDFWNLQKLTRQIEVESHTSQTPVGECSVSVLSENRPINLRKYSLIRRTNDFSMRKSFWGALSSLFQAFASVSLFRLIDSFLA